MSIDFGGAGSSPIAYPLEVVYVSMSFDITIAIIRDSEGRDLPIKGIAPQYADPFCEYLNSFQRVIEPKEDAFEIFKKSDTYLEMAAKTEEDNNMAEAYIEKLGQLFGLPRQKHYDSVFGSGAKIMCFSVFGKQTGLVSSVWPEEMILRRFGEMLKEFGRNEKVAAFIELLKIN